MCVAQCILFFLLLASKAVFADTELNLTPGVTPISHDIYDLHMTVLWICVVIGILVFGVMLYSIIYHRKSKSFKPAQFHEHLTVELAWSIIPLLILIAMAVPATHVLKHMSDESEPDLTIKVTGHQWKWEYEYLNQGVHFFSNINTPYNQIHNLAPKDNNYLRSVDHPLVVPIHKKIRFLITSTDVIHSWWVPAFGIKNDAVPGFINESWARINRAGTYHGQCAELCGVNHGFMPIVVTAMSETDFENWMTIQKGGTVPSTATATPPAIKPATTAVNSTQNLPTKISSKDIKKPAASKQASPAAATAVPQTPAATAASSAAPQTPAAPAAETAAPQTPAAATTTPAATTKLSLQDLMSKGEQIFLNTCSVCHQATGEGMPPTYPALKGSKIATGSLDVHLNRVLNGKPGTAMQAFKDQFSDEDLAAVITYERNSWGNNAGAVQADQVKAARAKAPIAE